MNQFRFLETEFMSDLCSGYTGDLVEGSQCVFLKQRKAARGDNWAWTGQRCMGQIASMVCTGELPEFLR